MAAERILIVDDSEMTLDVLERNLSSRGFEVVCASKAGMALALLETGNFDLLITDLKMPEMDGMELLRLARERCPGLPTMIITGYATIPGAVEAVRGGVLEYLAKPFTKGELYHAVERVMDQARRARSAGSPPVREPRRRFGLIGKSSAMTPVFAEMDRVAADPGAPVLIIGESGVGKRTAARGLSSGKPFYTAECSEVSNGIIEESAGGVLYISGLDLASAGELETISSALKKKQKQAAKIIAGASPGITGSSHLKNLYAQFAPRVIFMPPLRERKEDIPRFLISSAMRVIPTPFPCWPIFTTELIELLQRYDWPGNVSELMNTSAELIAKFKGRALEVSDLPGRFERMIAEAAPTASLEDAETAHIKKVLQSVGGNKSRAAEILKITRKTLAQKMKRK